MELEDEVGGERHVLPVRMDRSQYVPVAGDLLRGAVPGGVTASDDLLDPFTRGLDPLDAVRRLRAGDDGGLPQRLEHLRSALGVELLLATVFPDPSDRSQQRRGARLRLEEGGREGVHGSQLL